MGNSLTDRKIGISVIVCCYNSQQTIKQVFECLLKQQFENKFPVEILVIDNNSKDSTSEYVKDIISRYNNWDIKLYFEPKQGLMYARERGIIESQYEYLLFCDDDNLLDNNYIQGIYLSFFEDERIGACGGRGIAKITPGKEPDWFCRYQHSYAVGSQVKTKQTHIYGAGMAIKHSALKKIYRNGFKSFLTGRKGKKILSGDDGEMVLAIKICGYKIKASDDLIFQHIIPDQRLNTTYLSDLYQGFGMMYPVIFIYQEFLNNKKSQSLFIIKLKFAVPVIKSFVLYLVKSALDKQIQKAYTLGLIKGYGLFKKDFKHIIYSINKLAENDERF